MMDLWSKLNNLLFKEKKQEERSISYKEIKDISTSITHMCIDTELKQTYQDYLNDLKNKPYLNASDKENFRTMADLLRIFCFHKAENILDELDLDLVRRLWFLMYHYIKACPHLYFYNLDKCEREYMLKLLDEVHETRMNLLKIKNTENENPFESIIKIAKEAGKEND